MRMVEEFEKANTPLVAMLKDWVKWQRAYAPRLGYPSRSLTCYSEGSQDFDSLCDAVDNQTFATVDACVQDLMPAQRAAVMRRYEIAVVFLFPRDNYEQCLLRGYEALIKALPRKGIII